jgi:hypothetical protein
MSASRRKHDPAFKAKVALRRCAARRRWWSWRPISEFIRTRFTPGRRRLINAAPKVSPDLGSGPTRSVSAS